MKTTKREQLVARLRQNTEAVYYNSKISYDECVGFEPAHKRWKPEDVVLPKVWLDLDAKTGLCGVSVLHCKACKAPWHIIPRDAEQLFSSRVGKVSKNVWWVSVTRIGMGEFVSFRFVETIRIRFGPAVGKVRRPKLVLGSPPAQLGQ